MKKTNSNLVLFNPAPRYQLLSSRGKRVPPLSQTGELQNTFVGYLESLSDSLAQSAFWGIGNWDKIGLWKNWHFSRFQIVIVFWEKKL